MVFPAGPLPGTPSTDVDSGRGPLILDAVADRVEAAVLRETVRTASVRY